MKSSLLFTLLSFVGASFASTGQSCTPPQPERQDGIVYQFENGTWVENIAVRANGNLLVTLIDRPELRQTGPEPETWAVWKADFSGGEEANVSKVADIPEAVFLDGMVTLDAEAGTVLVGDAAEGVIFRLNTKTGEYALVQRDESFRPPVDAALPVGLNGIRISENYLYYVNTFNPLYGRVPIDNVTGEATGPYERISTGVPADDFALDANKTAYVAGGVANVVTKIELNGESTVIAGNLNSSFVAAGTATVFGRTRKDEHVLYVTTGGASEAPVNGTFSEGGKIRYSVIKKKKKKTKTTKEVVEEEEEEPPKEEEEEDIGALAAAALRATAATKATTVATATAAALPSVPWLVAP
ncbi:hypothetical protein MY10362_006509 [Beauveria mimosiformis]